MRWILIGGLAAAAYFVMRSRAMAEEPPVALPAPPTIEPMVAPMPTTVKAGGEQWQAVMEGTYILTR